MAERKVTTLLEVCIICGDVKKKRFEVVDGVPVEIASDNNFWRSKKYCPGTVRRLMERYGRNCNPGYCPEHIEERLVGVRGERR